ncbi:MAG: hypothetical protein HQ567_27395 [Candidatus Nealsonbacteria bacterium]|nr:hypothetical protein [Candidatus Nealsonbacteria bacterium]
MKKCSIVWIAVLVAAVMTHPSAVLAESAREAYDNGEVLLAKADFNGAMKAFAAAARADRSTPEYYQHYSLVRQVIALRKRLDTERNSAYWQRTAQSLHSFYISNGIYSEALPLDKRVHARLDTTASAVTLAETQLAMDLNAEASAVLEALDAGKATTAARALLGVALARNGKVEEARQLAEAIKLSDKAGPGTLYSVARLHGEIDNTDEALGLLKRTFESIAPSRLEDFKNHARKSREFAALASTAAFAKVLETKSKIAESKCSGGSSCAGCPMRGKCPSSQGN